MNEEARNFSPEEGVVRLFPLPNLVMFPHVVQPLHIFEPRYRQLMADSLAEDRRFAMALLTPGWEPTYHRAPAIYPTVCLGEIHREERLFDGRYNLLLHGLRRARVLEELPTDRLYRVARVRWLDELPLVEGTGTCMREALIQGLRLWGQRNQAADAVEGLLVGDLSLAMLSDVLAFSLPLGLELQQELLDEPSVPTRVRRLLDYLHAQNGTGGASPTRSFPPRFSPN